MTEIRNVSFTGHRNADAGKAVPRLREKLEKLILAGADMFYAGGAVGFDMLAAETVLELKVTYPWVSLVLVLPCPPEEQSASFSPRSKAEYFDILRTADSYEIVSPHYTASCMKLRNARLIEYADVCVSWFDEKREIKSGTAQTVRMALNKGIEVINLFC